MQVDKANDLFDLQFVNVLPFLLLNDQHQPRYTHLTMHPLYIVEYYANLASAIDACILTSINI
jgi:hypothetical protein